jgi:hypothetical protein
MSLGDRISSSKSRDGRWLGVEDAALQDHRHDATAWTARVMGWTRSWALAPLAA